MKLKRKNGIKRELVKFLLPKKYVSLHRSTCARSVHSSCRKRGQVELDKLPEEGGSYGDRLRNDYLKAGAKASGDQSNDERCRFAVRLPLREPNTFATLFLLC